MKNKLITGSRRAIDLGYTYVVSVVKSVYRTTYYHVLPLADVIEAGRWLPASRGNWPTSDGLGTWHGRIGQSSLPDKAISRQMVYRLADDNYYASLRGRMGLS